MQVLLVRHALPLRSEHGQGSDPNLSDEGIAQIARLPEALARFSITRVVSSPQRRAIQTPNRSLRRGSCPSRSTTDLPNMTVTFRHTSPSSRSARKTPRSGPAGPGHLPSAVDEDAFRARVLARSPILSALSIPRTPSRCSATAG